jgi:hypothetical protein
LNPEDLYSKKMFLGGLYLGKMFLEGLYLEAPCQEVLYSEELLDFCQHLYLEE